MRSALKVEFAGADDIKVPDRWHMLLHRLWSKAVGAPDYAKAEWMELESILLHAAKLVKEESRSKAAGQS